MSLSLQPRPASGSTAATLSDLLNRLGSHANDQQALQVWAEICEGVEHDEGFRFNSAGAQYQQDQHLKHFVMVMRLKNMSNPSFSELSDQDVIKREISNATEEQVILNMRLYLRTEAKLMKPSFRENERPRYSSVVRCRDSILFWIQRNMGRKKAPDRSVLLNASNETLQRIGREIGFNTKRRVKTYFGRLELAQLIDFDTLQSPCLAVAESNHMAWCMAAICGVRPGSIGFTKFHEEEFISFGDVKITRGGTRGLFNAQLTFRYLKGNRDGLRTETNLTFNVSGATVSNHLPMSIPHRLLIMLLRRSGLEAHETLESLLSSNERNIAIRKAVLDEPICRAAGNRGLTILEDPASGNSLTNYLSHRAMDAGYPRGITLYCWRRTAGTEWIRQAGLRTAKRAMGHGPATSTLEKYYDQGLYDLPVFEMAMRMDTRVAQMTMDEDSSEVLTRMVESRRLRGAFLTKRVDEICSEDASYQQARATGDERAIRNIKLRIRKAAEAVYHDEAKRLSDCNLSVGEFERRKQEVLQPMKLVQMIRDGTRQALLHGSGNQQPSGTGQIPTGTDQAPEIIDDDLDETFTQGLRDSDLHAQDLVDAEDDFLTADQTVTNSVGVEVDAQASSEGQEERPETAEEFFLVVEAFMTTLGQKTFVEHSDGLRCELCVNNPIRTEEEQNRIWPGPAKLSDHQLGREHSRVGEISLRLHKAARDSEDGKYRCPYAHCKFGPWTNINKLLEHVRSSGPSSYLDEEEDVDSDEEEERAKRQEHDDEKRADGWYDDDFGYDIVKRKPKLTRDFRRRTLGLKYSDAKELPEPVKVRINASYDVVLGGGEDAIMKEVPDHYKGILFLGNDPDAPPYEHPGKIPEHYKNVLCYGNDPRNIMLNHPYEKIHHPEVMFRGDQGNYRHPGTYPELGDR